MKSIVEQIIEQSKPYEEADFLTDTFGAHLGEIGGGGGPLILFGAGSAGKQLCELLRLHNIEPICFCDNNTVRAGEIYCGLPIIPVSELRGNYKNSFILITAGASAEEIKRTMIQEHKIPPKKILTIKNHDALNYYTQIPQWYWSSQDLREREPELQAVYDLLCDEKSREIFVNRTALFTRGADYNAFLEFIKVYSDLLMPSIYASLKQFDNDIITLRQNETLVDGGAFIGDSTEEFIKMCGKNNLTYKKIICYEPDRKMYIKLQDIIKGYANIITRPFGLWSHKTALSFLDSDTLPLASTRIASVYDKNSELTWAGSNAVKTTEIQVTSIDEDIPDEDVTIIKLDVEGAETETLKGAEKTIKKHRPVLIISAYHKRDDIYELPLLVHEMVPEYKFYYRHFSNELGETTLFAT